ncbi:MAG: NrfD/PsrC family molybdoenzyme membrane anchor subunit [Longimicrobiales bacterium]
MTEITSTRNNHLIDPIMHVWGWEIPLYLFLGGLVAGIMIFTGIRMLRRGDEKPSTALSLLPWVAPLGISVGMFFLWLDLEHPFNAWRFYMAFRATSPMSWGAWILLGIYPVSILLAWVTTPESLKAGIRERLLAIPLLDRVDGWASMNTRLLGSLNIAMGAALGIYTGVLLGTMAARPLWNSALLGPLFLVSGLSTGAAFMLLFGLTDRERVFLGRADMGLIAAELAILSLWIIGLATGGSPSQSALGMILGGPYTAAFWALVVVLGLLAPLYGEWLEFKHGAVPGKGAAILVLIGGFALRWILVFAGQATGWVTEIAMR